MADTEIQSEPKNKSISDVIRGKKSAPKTEPKTEPKAEAKPKEAKKAAKAPVVEAKKPAAEAKTAAPAPEAPAAEGEAPELEAAPPDSEAPAAEEAKAPSEVDSLKQTVTALQNQIQNLANAIHEQGARGTASADGFQTEASVPQFSENPHMDRVFEDGVKSRYSDYEEIVGEFKAHAAQNPGLIDSLVALPPQARFEQMYQAGLMVRYQKKYGTLHLGELEKKIFAAGKKQATAELEKLQETQKKKALAGISAQPTDTTAARTSGSESELDEYRSPASFNQVLRRVWGTA